MALTGYPAKLVRETTPDLILRDLRRERLIEAAFVEVAERGIDGTSLARVARRADVPRETAERLVPGGVAELVGRA